MDTYLDAHGVLSLSIALEHLELAAMRIVLDEDAADAHHGHARRDDANGLGLPQDAHARFLVVEVADMLPLHEQAVHQQQVLVGEDAVRRAVSVAGLADADGLEEPGVAQLLQHQVAVEEPAALFVVGLDAAHEVWLGGLRPRRSRARVRVTVRV